LLTIYLMRFEYVTIPKQLHKTQPHSSVQQISNHEDAADPDGQKISAVLYCPLHYFPNRDIRDYRLLFKDHRQWIQIYEPIISATAWWLCIATTRMR